MSILFQTIFICSLINVIISSALAPEKIDTIFLRLYVSDNRDEYIDEKLANAGNLVNHMDKQKKTVIYIHGYTENVNRTSVQTVVGGYLKRGDHNIIAVDWSEIAGEVYLAVVVNVKAVGVEIASAIGKMSESGLSIKNIHVVGHSMGAQVAGALGRNLLSPLPRITGLDPAGPMFNLFMAHLSKSDAEFVDIIHTDLGFYGMALATGNVDFWPNKGRRLQPGCPTAPMGSDEDFCSHWQSWVFYAESLTNENAFMAVRCPYDINYSKTDTTVIPMGYATPKDVSGEFCLITSPNEPHGLGMLGAEST